MKILTKAGQTQQLDILEVIYKSCYGCTNVCPTLDDGITLTSGAGAWMEGSWIEIIPLNIVNSIFRICELNIEGANHDGVYELTLGSGEVGFEEGLCKKRFVVGKFATGKYLLPLGVGINCSLLKKGTRVVAKLACEAASKEVKISLSYKEF